MAFPLLALRKIKIHHVRNLKEVSLDDLGQVNVFYGRNGSGKTSVLEAIHLLGIARSFRGNSIRTLISHGESHCTVFGELFKPASGGVVPLGVQREVSGELQIKIGGSPARGVAQLVEQFPLQVITTDSFDLLTGAPAGRRQFLDWGVFHVEHRF